MGFLAIFKFGLICLDALAWPLFALGYPLLASIHAIETNSYSDMVKLVTYWVIFSLISLFEHAFMGMHQWLPFWPYMKLTITCWMVIPHFDGALYVYNHFVHPCLNVHMQSISNSVNKFQRFFLKHHFLADADNDVKGLEKPIASESKGTNSSILQNDMKVVQVTEKKEVGPVNLSKGTYSSVLKNDMKAVQVTEKKEVGPVNLSKGTNDSSILQNDMKAVQVTERKEVGPVNLSKGTNDSSILQNDMKAVQVTEKEEVGPVNLSNGTYSSILQNDKKAVQVTVNKEVGPVNLSKCTNDSTILQNDMKAVQVTEKKEVGPVNLVPEIELNAAKTMNGVMEVPEMSNIPSGKQQVQKEWTCAMCQVTTSSEITLFSHLQGRRHWDTWQELMKAKNSNLPTSITSNTSKAMKASGNQVKLQKRVGKKPQFRCTICNIYCSGPEHLDCHLWGKKHLARIQEIHSLARGEPA